jgi:hypothetical protein
MRSRSVRTSQSKSNGNIKINNQNNSQIIAGHIKKDYKERDPELARYLQFLRDQEKHFEGFAAKKSQEMTIQMLVN